MGQHAWALCCQPCTGCCSHCPILQLAYPARPILQSMPGLTAIGKRLWIKWQLDSSTYMHSAKCTILCFTIQDKLHHTGQPKKAYLQIRNSKLAILVHQQLPLGAASVAGVLYKGDFQRYQLFSHHLSATPAVSLDHRKLLTDQQTKQSTQTETQKGRSQLIFCYEPKRLTSE